MSAALNTDRVVQRGRPAWEPLVTGGGLCLIVAASLAHLAWLKVAVVDDAAISLRYGLTLFSGGGLRLTPWSPPVEGFSNPLWTVLIGLAGPLNLPPVAFMQVLGIVFGVSALVGVAAWGPAAYGRSARVEDLIAPLIAAANPSYLTWIGSGLETGLQAFLLAFSGALFFWEVRRGRGALFGVALGLLCLTHPDAPMLVLFIGFLGTGILLTEHRRPGTQVWRAMLAVLLIGGGYLAFRWAYFADWFPNTYYAKRYWEFGALHYIGSFVQAYEWVLAFSAAAFVIAMLIGGPARRMALLAAGWLLSAGLFAWIAHGDWMGEWRFFAPYIPLVGVPGTGVASALRVQFARARERLPGPADGEAGNGVGSTIWAWIASGRVRALLPSLVVILATTAAGEQLRRSTKVRNSPQFSYAFVARDTQPVKTLTTGQLHPLVAMPDLGGLSMNVPGADIVDVAGLADYVTAHHPNNLPALEDYLISEGPPVLVNAHGPSGQLNQLHRLRALYVTTVHGWWLLKGVTPTEDPRCPGGKSAVLGLGASGLAKAIDKALESRDPQSGIHLWRCARAYRSDDQLPNPTRRRALVATAVKLAEQVEERDAPLALRAFSLATLLDDENAHLRRRTEQVRSRVFPEPAR